MRNITRKRFILMTQLTTELLHLLAQRQDIDNNRRENFPFFSPTYSIFLLNIVIEGQKILVSYYTRIK
ncbi:hypothetical protein EFM45_04500 [Streptococcus thermophilus]|nr:hypothetical protein [Streptococcus thermophilus]MCT2912636.1 hypothetical protein [Streptococcus thermophilus]MCT2916142.1 hypothetical protein [Streptococcus thermophilus]CAD0164778.1 protein of unknown function [Streptococcus thermophilus]CAD0165566.1 protein of unknown function [Streptococcus thermophilus]